MFEHITGKRVVDTTMDEFRDFFQDLIEKKYMDKYGDS